MPNSFFNCRFTALFTALFVCSFVFSQKKQFEATQISEPLVIDAVLDEDVYRKITPASNFVQIEPHNGRASHQPTEAWLFYDQKAIYLGVMLYDHPDSIYNYLTERDNTGMSDYFGVYFDPYNQGLVAYGFFVTPSGIQMDLKASKNDGDQQDSNWNAVWESKTRITDRGWIVEMKIPFSALRFSEKAGEQWGLNIFRNIQRHNSRSSWTFIDRQLMGFIHQQGELTGIGNIKSPVRLSLSPYLAAYAEPRQGATTTLFKGGLDLKYGISDAFTLDMMLIPDFGQIQSDDQQLNLSPYEIHYNEKRQFFTEGTELFSRGGIFYSRRIGARPKFSSGAQPGVGESSVFSPVETQLVNATKLSGRTNKGLGIGVLNAMSLKATALIKNDNTGNEREVIVQPFTNYNVTVIDQALKNNSYFSLINTHVSMAGHPFSANVTATQFEFRDNSLTYALQGKGAMSNRGNEQREKGYYAELGISKTQGTYFWGIEQLVISDRYNPNDLGYLQRNNRMTSEVWGYYQQITPGSTFREWNIGLWSNYNRLYNPAVFTDLESGIDFKSQLSNYMSLSASSKFTTRQRDYYEPRVGGRYYYRPLEYEIELEWASDNRKPLRVEFDYEWRAQPFSTMRQHELESEISWRIGQRLELEYTLETELRHNDHGFTKLLDDKQILFARRNLNTLANTLESVFIINNTMGLRLRTRHYWSGVSNREFFLLQDDGSLSSPVTVSQSYNINYNAFTIDLIYRWIFLPGSELSVAWKTQAYVGDEHTGKSYIDNLKLSWQNQLHSLSLKVLYYFDINTLLIDR